MGDQQGGNPPRVDWRGADLRNVSFAGVSLEGADLRAADLSGTSFVSANLRYADLRGARCHGTTFQNANLYGAKMQGIEAFQADFRGANLQQANLGGAYLEGAMLPPPQPVPGKASFWGAVQPQEAAASPAAEKDKGLEL